MDLSSLAKEALNVQSKGFLETLKEATLLLRSEKGQIGNLTFAHHLISVRPTGEALVIGDLHGDFESLVKILQESRFVANMSGSEDATLIFLGDYGDRGDKPAEVYELVLRLKLAFPKQVVLLRGNHEGPKDLVASPHDLPFKFQEKFREDWQVVYEQTQELWTLLHNAAFVENRFLMVHGGVSPEIRSLQDIAEAHEGQNVALLEELLWNDPTEGLSGMSFSPRGAGKLFGEDVTTQVLERLNASVLVRGHEASDIGFKISHGNKVLTLFSRKGAPYYNRYGAYLLLPLSQNYTDIRQLTQFIHKF